MKISAIKNTTLFGRALTTKETKEFEGVQQEARRQLGLDKTTATIFDFSVPSLKNDTGIGTSFSQEAQDLAGLLKVMCGVNSIQLQPQGEISNYVHSPYSGTGFSLGMHIIDLNKLSEDSYGKLLTMEDLKTPYMTRVSNHDSVNYDNVFSEANKIVTYLKNNLDNIILGPASSNMPKINNIYYVQIIIKFKKTKDILSSLEFIKSHYQNKINVDIDLNPLRI